MTIVITKGDNPGNYIYVDVNADFATGHLCHVRGGRVFG